MKWGLLILIRLYWKLIPEYKRRHCLFCESCSTHVYRITREKGFMEGLKAFIKRYAQCRPGYTIFIRNNSIELQLKNGDVIEERYISRHLLTTLAPYKGS